MAGLFARFTGAPAPREPFVIAHADLVGAARGTLRDMSVVVGADGLIERVAPSAATAVPAGYRLLDASGRTVMPGLIDAHAHLFSGGKPLDPRMATPRGQRIVAAFVHSSVGRRWIVRTVEANAAQQLCSGVTTLRTLGDAGYEVASLRDRVAAGAAPGPRILASGPLLAIPEGHGAPLIALTSETPDGAAADARENLSHGVDVIKIAATGGVTDSQVPGEAGSPQMTVDQMRAICDVAHGAGVIVAAHAQGAEGVRGALLAGVDTIEHGCELDDDLIGLFLDNPRSLRGWSALVPTLAAGMPMLRLDQSTLGLTDVQMGNGRAVAAAQVAGARQAREAGVTVGVGIDSGMTFVPQYSTWRELDLLVKFAGFTPAEAIDAATRINARILGVDGVTGVVREGLAADLMVVDGDPLADLSVLEHPALVVASGRPVFRPDSRVRRFGRIDSLLDRAYGM